MHAVPKFTFRCCEDNNDILSDTHWRKSASGKLLKCCSSVRSVPQQARGEAGQQQSAVPADPVMVIRRLRDKCAKHKSTPRRTSVFMKISATPVETKTGHRTKGSNTEKRLSQPCTAGRNLLSAQPTHHVLESFSTESQAHYLHAESLF